jgi:DNA (cytosine-5)-methyltransferase 1
MLYNESKRYKQMKYGSVCSGVEAATVAWHPLGWKPQWFSEIENFPSAVLKHHYPDVPNYGDMTKYKEWPNDQSIDLLVGGTPCQSFSVAGLRKGLDDPRGNLMLTYLAIAARYSPRWVVWENVPGVLSSNRGRDFGTFLGALGKLGYGFAYRVLDAQYFGVAQRRRRVFVVGYLGDWRRAAAVLFERESLSGHPAPSRETREEVAPTVTQGAPFSRTGNERVETEALVAQCLTSGYPRLNPNVETLPIVFGAQNSASQGDSVSKDVTPTLDKSKTPAVFYSLAENTIDRQPHNGGNGIGCTKELMYTLNTVGVHAVASYSLRDQATPHASKEVAGTLAARDFKGVQAVTIIDRAAYNQGKNAQYEPRIEEAETTPTIVARGPHAVAFQQNTRDEVRYINGDGNITGALAANSGAKQTNYVHQEMKVRRLTPRECERLQGFPDDYTQIPYRNKDAADCPDGPRYKAMGNSMAVPVMRWIGERIKMIEDFSA